MGWDGKHILSEQNGLDTIQYNSFITFTKVFCFECRKLGDADNPLVVPSLSLVTNIYHLRKRDTPTFDTLSTHFVVSPADNWIQTPRG